MLLRPVSSEMHVIRGKEEAFETRSRLSFRLKGPQPGRVAQSSK